MSPGTPRWPLERDRRLDLHSAALVEHRRDDDAVALALEQLGGARGLVLAGDEHRERAAALRRHVPELEVLDVDALGAQRLRDAREHARPVGDVDAEALQRSRVGVLALEHPAAVLARLADPAGEEPGVAALEGGLDLLEPPPLLGERLPERVGVVEEDVDPDARVRARDARHVAQGAAGVRERLVPVDPGRAGVVGDDVREHVRRVARQRDEPVVRLRRRSRRASRPARRRGRAAADAAPGRCRRSA